MDEPAGKSWLRIWALFGLPIVPGFLLLFIEDSTLPVPCAVISPGIKKSRVSLKIHDN